MRIGAARVHPYRLRLREPIETAHGRLVERCGFLLELVAGDGVVGWGDACPIGGFGMENADRCGEALAAIGCEAIGRDPERNARSLLERADTLAPDAPGARGALDVALADLGARAAGVPLAAYLEPNAPSAPELEVSGLLAADAPAEVTARALALLRAGFRTFKLKVGARPWNEDRRRIAAARDAIPLDARLRLDANGAWSEADARKALGELDPNMIELVEQPVPAADVAALARLRAQTKVRIAADEAVASASDAHRVLAERAADVVVLKPAALGGPRRALEVAVAARTAGCAVFVTTLLDSAIGVTAAAQLAAALPRGRPADGLATSALFEEDVAAAPTIRNGRLAVPTGPGLGVTPDADSLSRVRCGPVRALGR